MTQQVNMQVRARVLTRLERRMNVKFERDVALGGPVSLLKLHGVSTDEPIAVMVNTGQTSNAGGMTTLARLILQLGSVKRAHPEFRALLVTTHLVPNKILRQMMDVQNVEHLLLEPTAAEAQLLNKEKAA